MARLVVFLRKKSRRGTIDCFDRKDPRSQILMKSEGKRSRMAEANVLEFFVDMEA